MQSLVSWQVDEDVETVLHYGNRGVRRQSKQGNEYVRFRAEEAAAIPENKQRESELLWPEITDIKQLLSLSIPAFIDILLLF